MVTDQYPNICLIVLDTLRKDVFEDHATEIQSLSDVEFSEMRATAGWTVPSHGSIFTGELTHEHGGHSESFDFSGIGDGWMGDLPGEYSLRAVSANQYISPQFGVDWFDELREVSPTRRFAGGMDVQTFLRETDSEPPRSYLQFLGEAVSSGESIAPSLANGAALKLTSLCERIPAESPFDGGARSVSRELVDLVDEDGPTFCYANYMDAHGPHAPHRGMDSSMYDCPPTWHTKMYDDWTINLADGLAGLEAEVEWMRQLYRADVEYLDRVIAETVGRVQETTDRPTVVIICGDHGEMLGFDYEDYRVQHLCSLHDSLLHVPFHIVDPRREESETRDGLASLADVGEIVRGLVAGHVPNVSRERVFAEIAGAGTYGDLPDEADEEYWNRWQRAAYDGETRYVWDELGGCEDVPEWATDRFGEWEFDGGGSDVDDAVMGRLEELGYA